jgi:hypothetical protein
VTGWVDRLDRLEDLRARFSSKAVVVTEILLGGDLESALRVAQEYRQIEREHRAELESLVAGMKEEVSHVAE